MGPMGVFKKAKGSEGDEPRNSEINFGSVGGEMETRDLQDNRLTCFFCLSEREELVVS